MRIVFFIKFNSLSQVDAYHLLQALSGQPWGRRLVMTEPGLCEYLLNRSVMTSSDPILIIF